jgi:hypothetical protein
MPTWVISAWAVASDFVQENRTAFLIDFLLTLLIAHPLYTYFRYAWAQKAEEINSSLAVSAKQAYLRVFQKIEVAEEQAGPCFDIYYRQWYGRKRLVCPILLVLLVAGSENFVLGQALLKLDLFSTGISVLPASIAGAYTFVTWNFFASVQRRNLSIADIMRGALRLAIAVPLGFALAGLSQGAGPFLAFAVGVFPLDTISTILRQLANKKLMLELGAASSPSQVSQLSGVDAATADRISDADITTIAQLAWCDPIDLTMRSHLRFGSYRRILVTQGIRRQRLELAIELSPVRH